MCLAPSDDDRGMDLQGLELQWQVEAKASTYLVGNGGAVVEKRESLENTATRSLGEGMLLSYKAYEIPICLKF